MTGRRAADGKGARVARADAGHGHLLVALLLLSSCRKHTQATDEDPALAKQVRCAAAEVRSVRDSLELHGTVVPLPDRDAVIAPQVAGRILRVLVHEGERVRAGQPLARIDAAPLSDEAKHATAQLEKASAERALAETSHARVQRVFDRGIAARQELDDAVTRVATARAIEAEASATLANARRQLGRAVVRSPLQGVVLRLIRRTGELVDGTPATPLLEVGDPSRLELLATAAASELVKVAANAKASVEFSALPGVQVDGTVSTVSPAVDRATGLGSVRIELELGAKVRPPVGIGGTAHVPVGEPREAIGVPAAALRAAIGQEAEIVLCGSDGRAHVMHVWRGVSSGKGDDAWVEVRLPGEGPPPALHAAKVVVSPVLGVSDGERLEPAR